MGKMVVIIPKGDGGYFWGIGLVEFLWKTMTGLLKLLFTSKICFHDVLHRFWEGRRRGTADLKAKLLQQLMAMREAFLYDIFLDYQKAYAALDWDRCMEIFALYGVGPRTLRILWTYWGCLTGRPLFPMIFKVVVDTVILGPAPSKRGNLGPVPAPVARGCYRPLKMLLAPLGDCATQRQ